MFWFETDSVTQARLFRVAVLTGLQSWTWPLVLRFGMVGLLNAGFGYATFALLLAADAWPSVALAGAMIAGVAFNFQTSRRLVFRSGGDVLRFVTLYGVVLVVNLAALSALRWCGLADLDSQALLTLPIAAISFLGQHIFVFGPSIGSI
jgi:putative flippase GtrA